MHLTTSDSQHLEAIWSEPDGVDRAVVFCHPHPLQRGTMRAPLMEQLTTRLVDAGIAVLRFNFRGVGESTGTHDHGRAELLDIDAAWAEANDRYPDGVAGVLGWSFGAATSLNWLAGRAPRTHWVGIAPPVASERAPALPESINANGRKSLIIGDRDQFTTSPELAAYAATIGAEFHSMPGSDHFFYFREDRLAELILDGLR